MVQVVWIGAGRLRLFFLVRVGGTDMSNTRGALYSKPRQEIYVKTGTLGVRPQRRLETSKESNTPRRGAAVQPERTAGTTGGEGGLAAS